MNLIPRHSFWDLNNFFEDENWPRIFSPRSGTATPKVDVYEEGGNVVVEAELPGINAEDIDVEVDNDIVKIEAKTEQKQEEKKKGYYRQEMSSGYYKRVIPLPVDVQESKASADYEKGVLKITVPKEFPKKKEDKKVKVNVKQKTEK